MKIYNLGSINIDFVYTLENFARPGETVACKAFGKFAGGKGFNQSTALARAGADVAHIGAVGADGKWLVGALAEDGADVSRIAVLGDGTPTGHAIIQVDARGQNCIIIETGANGAINRDMVCKSLHDAKPGDWLLAQNETSGVNHAISCAKSSGLRVAYNPAPMNEKALEVPVEDIDLFVVNETEGIALAEKFCRPDYNPENHGEIFHCLRMRFGKSTIILTLGADGVMAAEPGGEAIRFPAHKVDAIDTTAAGDCFTGYLLAQMADGAPLADALKTAAAAAAICVTRHGASPSVPYMRELQSLQVNVKVN